MLGWVTRAVQAMQEMFPLELAEPWDNVGILVESSFTEEEIGESGAILFTNDLTEKVLEEALSAGAKLIITYHPRPFGSFKRLNLSDVTQRIVLRCARAGICVYSPHTACDNASGGVNDWLAQAFSSDPQSISPVKPMKIEGNVNSTMRLEAPVVTTVPRLKPVTPSIPSLVLQDAFEAMVAGYPGAGSGRIVQLQEHISLKDAVEVNNPQTLLKYSRSHVQLLRQCQRGAKLENIKIKSVAVQAGSGGSVLLGCPADLLVMGEMSHHDALAAIAAGSSVILTEHSNSERGFLPQMVDLLQTRMQAAGYDKLQYIISTTDSDPLSVV
ncbi:hypothetical protein GUITHDRAFT_111577 [Guillardia theta CCMP2712]|uniref:NIF3-like protein 1 n=1 Tax=Guillardia theta (strain CCMP2712) TaxID=905079 RepID=L1J1Z6_GUITC|nr:hypothetical protein GUITHDRAFT_111577 [Guillardia theta CCMP2712]EKX42302.1 hypothetical protein GUITHDRAFT_111577 [Guillardia theta CCMP2712]|eukprot:XP_005829282.1 hypothetical protein GUITHDRAFT_111577 [Guillardia theta CCMP2712]